MYTLLDLNTFIRQVIALNFQKTLWITAEIAQLGQSKGHFYLDLVQKGSGEEIIAQGQATLWATEYKRLLKKMGLELTAVLQEGLQVKCLVQVEYHERYGLKLNIQDFDPAYTLGQLQLRRRQTLEQLRLEGLLAKNKQLALPQVLQRLAVISSDGAAGLQDFKAHLENNSFGYHFDCQLFNTAVQGKNTETEIMAAAKTIAAQAQAYDGIVIIRGGGSKIDLSAFDGYVLCAALAQMPLPLIVGIGHDIDETVLDKVAHTSLKTPTAVADFILQHNLFFESQVLEMATQIRYWAEQQVYAHQLDLERHEKDLYWSASGQIRSQQQAILLLADTIPFWAEQLLQRQHQQLDNAIQTCQAYDPNHILQRGYSITKRNGQLIKSPTGIAPGDVIETTLHQGVIQSKII
jgi:exodeoxyribonuclease VII large subunit